MSRQPQKPLSEEKNHFVYALVEKNGPIFYIGESQYQFGGQSRVNRHLNAAFNGSDSEVSKRIRQVLGNGGLVEQRVLRECLSMEEALLVEHEWITRIGLDNLCNTYEWGYDTRGRENNRRNKGFSSKTIDNLLNEGAYNGDKPPKRERAANGTKWGRSMRHLITQEKYKK
jgi:hypothetical protein